MNARLAPHANHEIRTVHTVPLADVGFVLYCEHESLVQDVHWSPHTHEVDELLWSSSGTISVRVEDRLWTLPAGAGVWIPANTVHEARAGSRTGYGAAFLRPGQIPTGEGPAGISLSPLLRELLELLADPEIDSVVKTSAEQLAVGLLEPSQMSPGLPIPQDRRIASVVAAIVADPGDPRGLDTWAREAGLSPRTLGRAFVESTTMTFGVWRNAVRMHEAAALLSTGASVQEIAHHVGFSSSSSFISAFRKAMGQTPGRLTRPTAPPA